MLSRSSRVVSKGISSHSLVSIPVWKDLFFKGPKLKQHKRLGCVRNPEALDMYYLTWASDIFNTSGQKVREGKLVNVGNEAGAQLPSNPK